VYYLSGSLGGGVAVEVEQVVELLLGRGHLGEHAAGAGASAGGGVEQQGFLDASEVGEQFAGAEGHAGVGGFAAHEVDDGEGGDAVGDVDADLLVGPVSYG